DFRQSRAEPVLRMPFDHGGHVGRVRFQLRGWLGRGDLRRRVGARVVQHAALLPWDSQQFHFHGTVDRAHPMKPVLRLGDEQGASAIEFALTAPIFFLMIFGIITIGLMLWTQLGLQHGSEMAARCATVNTTTCNNNTNIKSFASSNAYGLNPDPSVFTV